jgi:hypothetical protein
MPSPADHSPANAENAATPSGPADWRRVRIWLVALALGLPGALLPQIDYFGINRTRISLGWPISGLDVLVGNAFADGVWLHLQPNPLLLPTIALWAAVMVCLRRLRQAVRLRAGWIGAVIQDPIAGAYCVLVFFFFHGCIELIWEYRARFMNAAELERSCYFAERILPGLYATAGAAVLITLALDAYSRRWNRAVVYVVCGLAFGGAFWLSVPLVRRHVKYFDDFARVVSNLNTNSPSQRVAPVGR